jgi:hypothetical protein
MLTAGALVLPGEALAGWGDENWGVLVWGDAFSIPGLGLLGLAVLVTGLAATAVWTQCKRRPALGLTLSLVLLAIPLAVAAGTVTTPNIFVNGTTADADQVNANFDAVETAVNDNDARITTVEGTVNTALVYTNPVTGEQYSNNASYCGSTPAIDGAAGGYVGVKTLCETACGSATAHVCEAREMVRFAQTGGTIPTSGWTTSGGYNDPAGRDCTGFTTASITINGAVWTASTLPSAGPCNISRPFLCCD